MAIYSALRHSTCACHTTRHTTHIIVATPEIIHNQSARIPCPKFRGRWDHSGHYGAQVSLEILAYRFTIQYLGNAGQCWDAPLRHPPASRQIREARLFPPPIGVLSDQILWSRWSRWSRCCLPSNTMLPAVAMIIGGILHDRVTPSACQTLPGFSSSRARFLTSFGIGDPITFEVMHA